MRGGLREFNTNLRELVLTRCECHVEYFKKFGAILIAIPFDLLLHSDFQCVIPYFMIHDAINSVFN